MSDKVKEEPVELPEEPEESIEELRRERDELKRQLEQSGAAGAEEERTTSSFNNRRRCYLLGALIALVIIAVIVSVSVVLTRKQEDTRNTQEPDDNPDPQEQEYSWVQLVLYEGTTPGDELGAFVSLSETGDRVAISAPFADSDTVVRAGLVRVFDIAEDGSLLQIGKDLYGRSVGEKIAATLSGDVTRLVVASAAWSSGGNYTVRVFELISDDWSLVGDPLPSATDYEPQVALNYNGALLAIGNPLPQIDQDGYLQVYQDIGNSWSAFGQRLFGDSDMDERFGFNTALSHEGHVLATASYFYGATSGIARVFTFVEGQWVPRGNPVEGRRSDNYFGGQFSLSADGNHFAASSFEGDYARVSVYSFEDSTGTWPQTGNDLVTSDTYETIVGVSLSSDGRRLALGRQFGGVGTNRAYIYVYDLVDGYWVQIGGTISFESFSEMFYSGLSMSADGRPIAVGGELSDSIGHVQIFEIHQ